MPQEGGRDLKTTPGDERDRGLGTKPTFGTRQEASPLVPQKDVDVIIQGFIAEASRLTGSESTGRFIAAGQEAAENAVNLFQETKVGQGLKGARKKVQKILSDPTIEKIIRTGETTQEEFSELSNRYGKENVIRAIKWARQAQKMAKQGGQITGSLRDKLGNLFRRK